MREFIELTSLPMKQEIERTKSFRFLRRKDSSKSATMKECIL
jgi:hypothetical protein